MNTFCMRIAGVTGAVTALFDSTPVYFRKYLGGEAADFSFTVTREALEFEQRDAHEEALREGFRPRVFTDPFLERAAICRAFARELFARDVLLLHGSCVVLDGKAYLFAARSGTGKSTHTRLWCQCFGSRAVILNDDKPFVALTAQGPVAWGSPWSGKHGLDANRSAPLSGICLLRRGPENRIVPAAPEELLPILRGQGHCPPGQQARFLALTQALTEQVGLWQLTCTPEPEAAQIAQAAMAAPK